MSNNSVVFGELQLTVLENQSSIKSIQDSVKLIEVAICSNDFVSKDTSENFKENACEASDVVVGEKETTVKYQEDRMDPNGKRKCTETDVLGNLDNLQMFEPISLSDDEEDAVNKRLRQTVCHNKFQNNPTLEIPPLPEEWTNITNLRGLEDKSNLMALSNSNAKRSTSSFGEFNPINKQLFQNQSPSPKSLQKRNNTSSSGKKSTPRGGSSSGGRIKIYKSLLPKVKCLIIVHDFNLT